MSTINTILIKRRLADSVLNSLPVLSGGELAFSEKNNTLYYGATGGALAIGGDGAFVSRTLNQNILGDKVFLGYTTLSSTTFSTNSLIDVGGNLLTNVAYPSANNDAASKVYVDDLAANINADFVDRTTAQTISGVKTFFDNAIFQKYIDVTDYVSTSAYKIDSTVVIDNDKNASFANIDASGNLTVQGDFKVYGASSVIETTVTATSAFSVTNSGSGPALTITQTGANDIATFLDDSTTALIIKDGGNVGVGTATPNAKLTVAGSLSASGAINGASTLDIAGATTLASTLNVTGASTLNSTLAVANAATFASTVSSAGALTVNGTSTLNGAVTVNNTLNTTGATTLGSTLNVTGAATFASTLSASGNADIDGTLTVDGLTTINNNLVVTGTTSIDAGKITANGSGRITGTAGVSELINFIIDGGSF